MEEKNKDLVEEKKPSIWQENIGYIVVFSILLILLILSWIYQKNTSGLYALGSGLIGAIFLKNYQKNKSLVSLIACILWFILAGIEIIDFGFSVSGFFK